MIKHVKNTALLIYVIRDLDDEKVIEIFYKNKLQKANQKEFRIEKVIKK